MDLTQKITVDEHQEQDQKSILIVDDEAIIRDLCSKALKDYRTVQAEDGEEAISIFRKGGIDLVLTDVMMPRMSGIELLKNLKEIEPTVVVIVMTGFAEKDVILNALKANADDFISKPLNLLQLKSAVDKALVKKALKEEIANLRSLDRLKTNFLSLVSHKFRTPITAISLFLQNLGGGVFDCEDPEFKQNTELIYEEACYLEGLVSDLLAFSKVMGASEVLKLESCNLVSILRQVIAESKEIPVKSTIKTDLVIETIPPVLVDREKVTFVFRQVIDNAFKFTDQGTITITLKSLSDAVELIVTDTGKGISREDLPKVFEKFYQVDEHKTGQIRGFGLGLFYAREFVQLHGGTITLDSAPGKGTTTTILLPFQEETPS